MTNALDVDEKCGVDSFDVLEGIYRSQITDEFHQILEGVTKPNDIFRTLYDEEILSVSYDVYQRTNHNENEGVLSVFSTVTDEKTITERSKQGKCDLGCFNIERVGNSRIKVEICCDDNLFIQGLEHSLYPAEENSSILSLSANHNRSKKLLHNRNALNQQNSIVISDSDYFDPQEDLNQLDDDHRMTGHKRRLVGHTD